MKHRVIFPFSKKYLHQMLIKIDYLTVLTTLMIDWRAGLMMVVHRGNTA